MNLDKDYYLGLDFGTQGVQCGIVNSSGEVFSITRGTYNTYYPEPGWVVQKPDEWVSCMFSTIKECISSTEQSVVQSIRGISVCATASTVVPVLQDGTALMDAILWMDNRASIETKHINETEHEVLRYCGNKVSVEWLIPKMLWLKNNRRDIYDKAFRIVEQLDYINYVLSGEWVASISQATCKSNYLPGQGEWNRGFFEGIGLGEFNRKLNTKVLPLGAPIGRIKKAIARNMGLPIDTILYQGGIDAHIAELGIGVTEPGDMGIAMGSAFIHIALSKEPIFNDGIWGPYCSAIVPDLYCLEGGQVSAGSIANWFLREFNIKSENPIDPYGLMMNEASKIAPGSKGIISLDYFQGNRTPYKDPLAKGVFYGLTISHTRAHMYRAILESVAYGTRNVIEYMNTDSLSIQNIMVCGGVTKNPLWLQIIADVCGIPINLTTRSSSAGILGCGIVAALGVGSYSSFKDASKHMVHRKLVIQPDMDAHEEYQSYYEDYLDLYRYTSELMHKIRRVRSSR